MSIRAADGAPDLLRRCCSTPSDLLFDSPKKVSRGQTVDLRRLEGGYGDCPRCSSASWERSIFSQADGRDLAVDFCVFGGFGAVSSIKNEP